MAPAATLLEIRTLTRKDVRRHIADFVAVADDVPGEYWAEENFLVDLPEKWTLSFAAWHGENLVAYAVISRKSPNHAHLHHFMVRGDFRGQGVGAAMVAEMESRVRSSNHTLLTLKVAAANLRGRRFYERFDYRARSQTGEYLILSKTVALYGVIKQRS